MNTITEIKIRFRLVHGKSKNFFCTMRKKYTY
jgi:hypothetical protein